MHIQKILYNHDFILTEAAVIEPLRRSGDANLHPRLENALLIYEESGKIALSKLYQGFINVARMGGVPITICTPTWRANQERILTAHITNDVNGDAVKYLKQNPDPEALCLVWFLSMMISYCCILCFLFDAVYT